ncbi:Abi family protein [Lactobacillus sp. R2/2]|nr:Abi family protein [Lactobacillus sp. R2/2]
MKKSDDHNKVFKEKVSDRDGTLARLNKITKLNTQPFKHYREKYNNIPPWILSKGLSFGNLVYWFRLSKPNIRNVVISRMLDMDLEAVKNNENNVKLFFGDVIRLYNNYRNLAAHNGRMYDHRSNLSALQKSSYIYNENRIDVLETEFKRGTMRSSIGVVLCTLDLFENKTPYGILLTNLKDLLNKYLERYPEDKEYLYKTMELYGSLKLPENSN